MNNLFVSILSDEVLKKRYRKESEIKREKEVEMSQLVGIARCKEAVKTSVLKRLFRVVVYSVTGSRAEREKHTHLSIYYSQAALCISPHLILSSDHDR